MGLPSGGEKTIVVSETTVFLGETTREATSPGRRRYTLVLDTMRGNVRRLGDDALEFTRQRRFIQSTMRQRETTSVASETTI